MRTETVFETLVVSPVNDLTRLIAPTELYYIQSPEKQQILHFPN